MSAADDVTIWEGDFLWRRPDLPPATMIDCSRVEVMGSWLHDWFRRQASCVLIGANAQIQRQLEEAQVPVLFYARREDVGDHRQGGVSPSERAMLWS